jgi:N-methylhydantoinase B/oxoprolinase/acetone carboxylase alpha subunit
VSLPLAAGDVVTITTPGGGGWGPDQGREPSGGTGTEPAG